MEVLLNRGWFSNLSILCLTPSAPERYIVPTTAVKFKAFVVKKQCWKKKEIDKFQNRNRVQ